MEVKCSNLSPFASESGSNLIVEVVPDPPLFAEPFEIVAQAVLTSCGAPSASLAMQGSSIRVDIAANPCMFPPRLSPPPPRLYECAFAVDGLPAGDYQLSAHLGPGSVESSFTIDALVPVPLGLATTMVLAVAVSALGLLFVGRARRGVAGDSPPDVD